MIIKSIKLKNFRNYIDEEIFFNDNMNIITGKNAQGKTNLLEAIYILSCAKSFRSGKEKNFIRFDNEMAQVEMNYSAYEEESILKLKFSGERKKEISYNGIEIKKNSELSTKFCVTLFIPEHLELVKGSPEERRKFLDIAISQLKPKYQNILAEYTKVVSQKNYLLKKRKFTAENLDVWNDRLAKLGAYLIFMRGSYVKNLSEKAMEHHLSLTKGAEKLSFTYSFFDEFCLEGASQEEIRNVLAYEIMQRTQEEIQCEYSLIGPHRDDININLNGKSARLYASQGQQRSIVLSMKLSESEIVKESIGEFPVILLDDFMSELDKNRQLYVKKNLLDKQVIITTCLNIRGRTHKIEDGKEVK